MNPAPYGRMVKAVAHWMQWHPFQHIETFVQL